MLLLFRMRSRFVQAHVPVDVVQVDFLVNVAVPSPALRHLELEVAHVQLHCLGRPVTVPQFETALDVLVSGWPVTLNIALEGLSEDGVELLDVLLQPHEVRVKGEHVVDAFVLEALDVDGFVLPQLNQVANPVVFGNQV